MSGCRQPPRSSSSSTWMLSSRRATPTAQTAHDATQTIPIVMIASGDPLVKSLGHPGGNVTGLTYYATELTAKRLELLREAVPNLTKIGVLADPVVDYLPFKNDTLRAAAALGLGVVVHNVSEPPDVDVAIEEMANEGAGAVFVLPDLMLASQSDRIGRVALSHRLPTMAWGQWFTRDGCLMAYSASQEAFCHVPGLKRALAEAFRILRKDGRLVFTDWVANQPLTRDDAQLMWEGMAIQPLRSIPEYRSLVESVGFRVVSSKDLTEEWRPILEERLAMYQRLREEARQAGTPTGHDAFHKSYIRFVELIQDRKMGGTRIVAAK